MSNLINTYPVFESSQVLTSSQLNQVVSYLDQQSRLTRVKLVGMGIVCGLELRYDDSPDTQITISKGTAVTSEGFLVSLGDCPTSWYRPYNLPEGVQYNPFGDPEQDVTLYELLKEMPEEDTDVLPLDDDPAFLDDKFVLLFLETFDNDLKSCLGNTCDELGIDRIFTVRKLLISKGDLDLVLTRSANVGNLYPEKFELPDIVMPRTLFDPDEAHSQDYTAFSEHYANSFLNSVYPALFGDDSTPGALTDTYSVYELLLGPLYDFENPFETTTVNDLEELWTNFAEGSASPGPDYRGVQYFYDFLKDLILGYNEFRETAFDLMSECCPDMSRFPKHIMLGRAVVPNETAEEAGTYRHGFIQPPIYNHQKYLMEKTVSLHKRLVLMVETFNLDRVNNPGSGGEQVPPLRITPSDEKNTPLSERSIPYYYDSKEEVAIVGETSLEQHWNFDITRKKLPATTELTLSYENQANDQSSIVSPLETPLFYDLDSYPFLRIEGHIGQDYQEVVDGINMMKSSFDLPFDTVALQLDPDAELMEPDYSCGFEDLQEDYLIARSTLCAFEQDFKMLLEFVKEQPDKFFDSEEDRSQLVERMEAVLELFSAYCDSMPDCIDEFDFEAFQNGYKAVLQLIIYFNLLDKNLLDDIQECSVSSLYETFLRIYYAFSRRGHYLQTEAGVFSRFIRQHPGIDHQAGVYKGGTFILVYIGAEAPEVMADFNLPYLCCGTENCVPMCEDEDSDFEFDVRPLARPDYAVTAAGTPVDVLVTINDFHIWNIDLTVEPDEASENGGAVEQLSETGRLQYTPSEEFTGFDVFQYRLVNNETGESDTGTVTVLVEEPREESGCYSTEILRCWGMESVQATLIERDFDVANMNETEMLQTLLESLRETRGFSQSEIRSNVLEGEQSRRRLLTCIGISHNDNTTYQQLEQLIVNYQTENCGEVITQPSSECYSRGILNCWGMQPVQFALRTREIDFSDMSQAQMIDALLESLRDTGGFTQDEIRFNILESEQSRRRLLTCIGIPHNENTSYQQLEQLIVDYQNANCGGGGVIVIEEIPRIELTAEDLSENELRTILSTRGREVSEELGFNELQNEINRTSAGMSFSKAEVMLFTRERITNILRNHEREAPSTANKSELVNILFEQ